MELGAELKTLLARIQKEAIAANIELKNTEKQLARINLSGRLTQTKQNGAYKLALVTEENGIRKRKTINPESDEAVLLIRQLILRNQLNNLRENNNLLLTCAASIKTCNNGALADQIKQAMPCISDEIMAMALSTNTVDDWEKAPYELYDYKPEEKSHTTSCGVKVRSKSELLIMEQLYYYRLPTRYEQVFRFDGTIIAPDFTIRRADGKIFIWEHRGKTNDSDYLERQIKKTRIYEANGIVPWDNLIVTYDTADGNIDLRIIKATIESRLII